MKVNEINLKIWFDGAYLVAYVDPRPFTDIHWDTFHGAGIGIS